MTHFWWFLAGVVAGVLGLLALGFYAARKSEEQITTRRRGLFRMMRGDLDLARDLAKQLEIDALVARIDVLRVAQIDGVVTSRSLALSFADEIDRAWRAVGGDGDGVTLLRGHLKEAEFNVRTIALTFEYADDDEPEDKPLRAEED